MENELRYPLTDLAAGSMLRLPNGRGHAIVVFEGRVWITQENDLRDVVIDAGQSFSVDRPGLTLVQAFGASKVMVLGEQATQQSVDELPNSVVLHQRARQQRSAAIARALAKGFAALRRQFAVLAAAPARPARHPLRTCSAGC